MAIWLFREEGGAGKVDALDALPPTGFAWLDFVRGEETDWAGDVERLTGVRVHDSHLQDSRNAQHPPFFDGTSDYDMVIFRGLAPQPIENRFRTHATAFFLFERLLVTVRPAESVSIPAVGQRLAQAPTRAPRRPLGVMHMVLSAMVDRYLALREPLSALFQEWQTRLLDPSDPFNDWMALVQHNGELHRLETLCEEQQDAIEAWREGMNAGLDESLAVRLRDLLEHIGRVVSHVHHMQEQIESLVQIHFAAVAHRTNEVVRVLTVLSAIFLPLTLVAGVFGMNFDNMPELHHPMGYFVALGGMVLVAVILLLVFRRKRWI